MNFNINSVIKKSINFIIIFVLLILVFKFVFAYFTPFILGYFLCLILNPLVELLVKNKFPRGFASIIAIITFLAILSLIGTGLISKIISQAKDFSNEIPIIFSNVKNLINNFNEWFDLFLIKLPNGIRQTILSFYQSSIYVISDFFSQGITVGSVGVIKKIPNFFMVLVVGIISSFFMLSDKTNIENFILKQIPKKVKDNFNIVKEVLLTVFLGYVRAQAIIMSIISLICFLGLSLIHVKYALLLCIIIGFIDVLPVLGSGMILIPWGLYNLISRNYNISIALFVLYIIILITRQSIEHKILGKQIGVHPLLSLISIYIGLKIFGFVGIFIGPIFVVTIKLFQEKGLIPNWK